MLKDLRRFNVSVMCFAVSVITLGHALQINNGFFSRDALEWLTVAFVACVIGVLLHRSVPMLAGGSEKIVSAVLLAGIAWHLWESFTARPGFYLREDASLSVFRTG